MTKLSFLESIFSLTNVKYEKQLCILGLKFKFPRKFNYVGPYDDLPVQNNKIVFRTNSGAYTCNPKYIAEEIIRQNLPYELVWVVNKNILKYINDYPKNIRLVMQGTNDDIKEYSTAKVWVDNERRTYYTKNMFLKRKEQVYIQTFHGSLGIKKTGIERNDFNKDILKILQIDSEQIDYLTSNSSWVSSFFKSMFFGYGNILECGHPRNDIFFIDNSKTKEKVYEYFNIPREKKIVIYAPTLREDRDMNCYTLDFERLLTTLGDKFGGDWVLLARLHPFLVNLKDKFPLDGDNVIDATDYSDMQELLVSSDVLITDYSSCIYDFMLSGRPAFTYATDVDKYDNDRGLYYSLTTTPFPIATNNDEMTKVISEFDDEMYQIQVKKFLKDKGCIDDGMASKRVVELIKSVIENQK